MKIFKRKKKEDEDVFPFIGRKIELISFSRAFWWRIEKKNREIAQERRHTSVYICFVIYFNVKHFIPQYSIWKNEINNFLKYIKSDDKLGGRTKIMCVCPIATKVNNVCPLQFVSYSTNSTTLPQSNMLICYWATHILLRTFAYNKAGWVMDSQRCKWKKRLTFWWQQQWPENRESFSEIKDVFVLEFIFWAHWYARRYVDHCRWDILHSISFTILVWKEEEKPLLEASSVEEMTF